MNHVFSGEDSSGTSFWAVSKSQTLNEASHLVAEVLAVRMMISFRKLRLEKNISIFIAGELARFSAWQPHLLPRGLNMFHKSWMLKPLYYTSKTCCKKTRTMFSKKVFPSSQSPAELAFQVQQPASVSSPYCPLP